MVLESVAARVVVGIASKVGKDEERGVARVFGFALHGLPEFGAEAVGAANGLDVERVGAGVRHIDIVHGDPEETGGFLLHEPAGDVDRELVGTGERLGMGREVVDGKLKNRLELVQLEFAAADLRRVQRIS